MALPWFHVGSLPEAGDVVLLDRQETRHALGPRRLGSGDEIVLFDGRGRWSVGRIVGRDARGDIEVAVHAIEVETPESPRIELAASLPKGDRLSTMLDMATQLGVTAFRPLKCDFSVVSVDRKRQDPTERWSRILQEACKQSRRATSPEIRDEATPEEVIAAARARGAAIVVGDAEGSKDLASVRAAEDVVILIGPEGGFSPPEQAMLRDAATAGHVHRIAIGRGVLRVETAATALIAAIRAG
jgi:16S rRNA (uracil1498-N3)-methyltransferase